MPHWRSCREMWTSCGNRPGRDASRHARSPLRRAVLSLLQMDKRRSRRPANQIWQCVLAASGGAEMCRLAVYRAVGRRSLTGVCAGADNGNRRRHLRCRAAGGDRRGVELRPHRAHARGPSPTRPVSIASSPCVPASTSSPSRSRGSARTSAKESSRACGQSALCLGRWAA